MNLESEDISTFEVNVRSLYTILLKTYILIIDTREQILILRQEENLTLQKMITFLYSNYYFQDLKITFVLSSLLTSTMENI